MIGAVIVALLALAALVWVLLPLRRGPRRDAAERDLLIEEAEERKRAALYAILDVEEEHAVGKLSSGDLEVLRTQYEIEAISALHQLDNLGSAVRIEDDAIEAEISRIRSQMTCTLCGAIRQRGKPCPECGKV